MEASYLDYGVNNCTRLHPFYQFLHFHFLLSKNFEYPYTIPLLSVIATLIYPILFVAVLYLIGRNLDLKGALPTILLSLFIGCLVALIISNLIYYSLIPSRRPLFILLIINSVGLVINLIQKFFI